MSNYMLLGEMGTAEGPCSPGCSHLICVMKRHDAEKLCPGCKERIGLGVEVYLSDFIDRGYVYELATYWHRTCFEIYINQKRQQIAAEVALGWNLNGPMLETEIDEARRVARVLKLWQKGETTNEIFNSLEIGKRIQPTATKFRTVSSAERIEEAQKSDGVRRRGRRRAFLHPEDWNSKAEEPTAEPPPENAGAE
jgi:hypothetical protein